MITKNSFHLLTCLQGWGLSEGFIQAGFTPVAHVEMNSYACQTLETRAAYHYLKSQGREALQSYYDYERGIITREQLFEQIPQEERESVINNKEMSSKTAKSIYHKIDHLMEHKGINHVSVIIGGPPCQAYSLVGREQTFGVMQNRKRFAINTKDALKKL